MTADSPPRILFWVQHLLGIGHLARTAALARAAAVRGYQAHIVNGGPALENFDGNDATLHQLKPVRSRDEAFSGLIGPDGESVSDADWQDRRQHLTGLLEKIRPNLLVIEHYPFGRRAFRHEISAMIDTATRLNAVKIAVSVRDILVARKPDRWREAAVFIEKAVDAVFVHGDPEFVPLDVTFPHVRQIGSKLLYTGYVDVAGGAAPGWHGARGDILVSTGGGNVGDSLRKAVMAMAESPQQGSVCIRVGQGMAERAFSALQDRAPKGITVERNQADYRHRLAACHCSISQAGYNTVVDLMVTGAPAVLVPFDTAGETEQSLRAQRLTALGRAIVVTESDLSPDSLRAAIRQAVSAQPVNLDFNLEGAEKFADSLSSLIGLAS